jgi:hypothetical protein
MHSGDSLNAITKRNTPVVSQTGPRTVAGKKASSQNAQKGAIFTKGYLASENIEQKQMEYEALTVQWGAYDPTRQMILRTIEQANLGIECSIPRQADIPKVLFSACAR